MPVESHYTQEGPLKLSVSKCITERIDRAVQIAHPVSEGIETKVDAAHA